MNIRMVAMDMDDTFIRSDKTISKANMEAVKAMAQAGVYAVPSTGRTFAAMPRELKECEYLRYMITVNGARVRDLKTGEYVFSKLIPFDDVLGILELAEKFGAVRETSVDEVFRITAAEEEKLFDFVPPELEWFMRTIHSPVEDMPSFVREQKRDSEKLLAFIKDRDVLGAFCEAVSEKFDVTVTESLRGQVEVTAAGVSKGTAILRLGEYLGVEKAEIMAMGDSMNDMELLASAGFAVAMGNSVPELKAAADAVCEECDEDGFAKAIYRWVL